MDSFNYENGALPSPFLHEQEHGQSRMHLYDQSLLDTHSLQHDQLLLQTPQPQAPQPQAPQPYAHAFLYTPALAQKLSFTDPSRVGQDAATPHYSLTDDPFAPLFKQNRHVPSVKQLPPALQRATMQCIVTEPQPSQYRRIQATDIATSSSPHDVDAGANGSKPRRRGRPALRGTAGGARTKTTARRVRRALPSTPVTPSASSAPAPKPAEADKSKMPAPPPTPNIKFEISESLQRKILRGPTAGRRFKRKYSAAEVQEIIDELYGECGAFGIKQKEHVRELMKEQLRNSECGMSSSMKATFRSRREARVSRIKSEEQSKAVKSVLGFFISSMKFDGEPEEEVGSANIEAYRGADGDAREVRATDVARAVQHYEQRTWTSRG